MANVKISDLSAGSALAGTEVAPFVQSAATVKITATQIKTWTSASPTLVTPTLGVATATSINKVALTAPASSATLTIADGKTLTASNSLTLAGTDATVMTFPTTSATIARTDAANTFTGTQTIGALVATTVNGNTFTTGTGVLTIAASKTLTASNTITLSGTDSVAMNVTNNKIAAIPFIIDGAGAVISTGIKGDLEIPFACTISAATLLADQSGSIVVDIWKDTYANYPPTGADSITASAKPTISSATKSQDTTLTGWTTSVAAGDTLRFNVDSATTVTRVTLSLKVIKT